MVPQSPEQSNEREKPHQSAQLVEPQCESTSCPNSPSFTLPHIFLFALLFRLFPLLLWPHTQTYFQPDEFWQALEPAHRLVFGTGYLTWEWRNSGLPVNDLASKLEGPCWFIDGERLTSLVGSTLAWLTGRMGSRPSVSGWLMSNVEMGYNPTLGESIGNGIRGWLWPGVFSVLYQGLRVFHLDDSIWLTLAPRILTAVLAATTDFYTYLLAGKVIGRGSRETALFLSLVNLFHAHALTRPLSTSAETCLTVMALYYWPLPPHTHPKNVPGHSQSESKVALSLFLSAIAFVLRPTNMVLWMALGAELIWRTISQRNLVSGVGLITKAAVIGFTVLIASTLLDFLITGRIYLAFANFAYQNVFNSVSGFYGTSAWHYHLTQSLPILLTTQLPFAIPGFLQEIRGRQTSAAQLLSIGSAVTIFTWSCLPHKEWRFLHPLLPIFIVFAASNLNERYDTVKGGVLAELLTCIPAYLRINQRSFLWLTLTPILPWVYLTDYHGAAQVGVTNWLRTQGQMTRSIAFYMPCHSTPWQSHLHGPPNAATPRFLTCEPPGLPTTAMDSDFPNVSDFYNNFGLSLEAELSLSDGPDTVVLFGEALSRSHGDGTVKDLLQKQGFSQKWYGWNGFDLLQDEVRRNGGVYVYQDQHTVS